MSGIHPPAALITWPSPGLGSSFAGINIYRQLVRTPYAEMELAGKLRVPAGRSATVVEAQHRWWLDMEAGWQSSYGGRLEDGVNYYLSYIDTNGVESDLDTVGQQVIVPSTLGSWLVCNNAWWLSAYLQAIPALRTELGRRSFVFEMAGRDREVTRTKRVKPSKRASGVIRFGEHTGHDQARVLEAIAASGRQFALVRKLGDRYLGTLELLSLDELAGAQLASEFEFIVTGDVPGLADYNLPGGIWLDGTNDFISTDSTALLEPGSGSFSFGIAFADLTGAGSDYLLSKGSPVSTDGIGIRTTGSANVIEIVLHDGTNSATATITDADLFDSFEANPYGHTVGATYNATADTLQPYADGVAVGNPVAANLGTISNARRLFAGANNDGADAGTAFAEMLYRSHFGYARALTDSDWERMHGYLVGQPGVRAPGNASFFYDARDERSFTAVDETLLDISGNTLDALLNGSPAARGIPAPLGEREEAA